jgi:hypothetical protein
MSNILRHTALAGIVCLFGLPIGRAYARDDYARHPFLDYTDKEVDGSFVLDGSFVHDAGELQLNITNWGLIGSRPQQDTPYSAAPSAMWPAGSGNDFLFAAGLWVGAIKNGEPLVSTGQVENEILPSNDPRDTIYRTGEGDPRGGRYPFGVDDDDGDGLLNEDILDGIDNDEDGLIDEDFAAIGTQNFRFKMADNTALSQELWPSHQPLDIEITQQSFQWATPLMEDVVAFDYTIRNIGGNDLEQLVVGFYADADIGPRSDGASGQDDLVGFTRASFRGSDRLPMTVNIAYMYDCPGGDGDVAGYIGFIFLNSSDPPTFPSVPSFQHFAAHAPFEFGGEPTNDAQRYELLTRGEIRDFPTRCQEANDYRVLMAFRPSGGFFLPPGGSVRFQLAIVMGEDLDELRENASEATLAYYGKWFDRDGLPSTGRFGRETKLCKGDFGDDRGGPNPIFGFQMDCGDPVLKECGGQLTRPRLVTAADLDEDGCTFINMDCNYEFDRGRGECSCYGAQYDPYTPDLDLPCTGLDGKEHNVRWVTTAPPPSPRMRIWSTNNRVHLFWDSEVEGYIDELNERPAFESYQIWRADDWTRPEGTSIETGPSSSLWQLVNEFDVVDSYERIRGPIQETLPLGFNTGLAGIGYTPRALREDGPEWERLEPLRRLVERIVQENPTLDSRDQIRYLAPGGSVSPLGRVYPGLADWECCASEIDTLAWDAMGINFYEYIDRSVLNGLYYFYAVTTGTVGYSLVDGETIPTGFGLSSNPRTNFEFGIPQSDAQSTADRDSRGQNIYVVPNPATRSSLSRFSQLEPNEDDPTGIRIEFRNLPRALNRIKIYTLAGDLITELRHDGRGGAGSQSWNLVTRNGQEIVSGIYLYSVESDNPAFSRVIGRFVVVR